MPCAMLLGTLFLGAAASAPSKPPHLAFFLTDDLGYSPTHASPTPPWTDGLLTGCWGRPQTRRASTTRTSSRRTSTSSTPRASSSWTTTSTDTAPRRAPPFSQADCAPPSHAAHFQPHSRGALGRRPYKLAATRKNFNPATVKDGLHLSYKTIGDKLQSAGYSVRPLALSAEQTAS